MMKYYSEVKKNQLPCTNNMGESQKHFDDFFKKLLWADLSPSHPQNSHIEILLVLIPQDVTVFGYRAFQEVSKVK